MLQITLVWAALGLLIGAFAWLAGARSSYPRGNGRWVALARWGLAPSAAALAAVMGGWLTETLIGRLAATPAALGVAAVAALLISLLLRRSVAPNAPSTDDAPTSS